MSAASFRTILDVVDGLVPAARLVSFDIFDTLLLRRVEPEWVKRGVAAELRRLTLEGGALEVMPIDAFAFERRTIENEVAAERVARGLDNDAEHREVIARCVARHFSGDRAKIERHLADFELEQEKRVTFVRPEMRALLERLHSHGVPLVFASDMYLPRVDLEALLSHHDLLRYFARGYVSVEQGMRKATGRLFTHMLQAEGIAASRLLHIGDSALGDDEVPRKLGVATVLLCDEEESRRRQRLRAYEWAARHAPDTSATAFVNHVVQSAGRRVRQGHNVNYGIGLTFAPALVAFCEKLLEECRRRDIEHVYFVAREGLTFQRICRSLLPPGQKLRASYLFLSRASTFLPSMRGLEREDLLRFMYQYPRQSLRSFLKNLALPEQELLPLARECGFVEVDREIDRFIDDPCAKRFLCHPEVHRRFASHHRRARELFLAYLRDRGMFRHRRVALVDIGWKGSIQDNLVRALATEQATPAIHGFYLGLSAAAPMKQGLLADLSSDDPAERDVFRNSAMFEMLTTANHGTTVGYRWGRYQPRRAVPVLVHHAEEKRNALRFFADAQQAIFDWADDYGHLRGVFPFAADELKSGALADVARYVRYPTRAEADEFLRYSHVESFGVHEVTTYEWKLDLRTLARSAEPLRTAWQSLWHNPWREGALRRLGVPGANFLYDCWFMANHVRVPAAKLAPDPRVGDETPAPR